MGLKHDTLMIWRAPKHCTPPHLFCFVLFSRLLRNSSCHGPACTADLFARQNSRIWLKNIKLTARGRLQGGGRRGVWTPTLDILWRSKAVNKRVVPQGVPKSRDRGTKIITNWNVRVANIPQITPNYSDSQFYLNIDNGYCASLTDA